MISFRYKSTNCFLEKSSKENRLLAIDAGWPCTLLEYARACNSTGNHFNQISWAMVTHFHMDHAGLIGEFLDRGIRCLIFENQEGAIGPMEKMVFRSCKGYKPIARERLIKVRTEGSRGYFEAIGIRGEVLLTPGHSPDSVTFISDAQEAVIGDLYPLHLTMPEDAAGLRSWELIRRKKARHIYPSHFEKFDL